MDWFEPIYNYLSNRDLWAELLLKTIRIIGILVGTWLFLRIAKSALGHVFAIRLRSPLRLSERREATLIRLIENILTYVVYFIALVMILSEFEVDVTTLIAGAGVVGLAVGFGAQNLVRDIITGFFIIFEKQFSVGDYVRISGVEGFVEEIGLRVTKIKSWTGELHILPNGNINQVTNYSIHNSIAVVDVSIAYEEQIQEAEEVIIELMDELYEKFDAMIVKPEYLGVQDLGASEVVLRIISEVQPMEHWVIGREIRKAVKQRLDESGIEIPFPRVVMYQRDEQGEVKEKEKA
ncbi:mechanosensitive ion channel family protein [Pseudalkalibacillus hwajinpoensis]|uniref:Mechanosensitive ion channel family protein n=1 Tax=Guptibacillus hwajinpoensis TaxID=208199 RepID=A0A4U1MBI6_9BACL|nr:mechanosensitive ion channel family protein [Pseudalkalibacillus hwajinpoensis]TKD67662.1 mechanosensitive ion channel family protein [Pseudalkalibacillus hwajinpoensis]